MNKGLYICNLELCRNHNTKLNYIRQIENIIKLLELLHVHCMGSFTYSRRLHICSVRDEERACLRMRKGPSPSIHVFALASYPSNSSEQQQHRRTQRYIAPSNKWGPSENRATDTVPDERGGENNPGPSSNGYKPLPIRKIKMKSSNQSNPSIYLLFILSFR